MIKRNETIFTYPLTHPPLAGTNGRTMQLKEMKKTESQISSIEQEIGILAAIIQSSQDAIISKNLNGIVTSWNPGAERLFGYTAEEMIGQSITKLILPENLYEEEMILDKIRRGERVESLEAIRRHKTGRLINVSLTISPVKDSKGNIIGASKIGRDITEQKRAQQALEESEQRAWLAIEAAQLGTFEWNLTNNDFNSSDRLIEIFGFSDQESVSHEDLINRIHPEDREIRDKAVAESADLGALNYQVRIKLPDKSVKWIKIFGKVLYNQIREPVKIYGTVMDETESKLLEQRKNQFIAVASHELKTPLTSIKAYAQLLLNTYDRSEDAFLKTALSKIDSQINKMTKLVSDFLNLSKIEVEKMGLQNEEFDLCDLAKEVASDIQLTLNYHAISLDLCSPLMVTGDREKISQVLTNFLDNAVKYSPNSKEIRIHIDSDGNFARVAVFDKGIGVATEEQAKIFERFYRSRFNDNISFSGFGIGLYISAEIIRRHGGNLGVISEMGKGSEFYFTLPLEKKI